MDAEQLVDQCRPAERTPGATVHATAVALGISDRQLRRRFRRAVGIRPTSYRRITRIHHVMAEAADSGDYMWARVACE